jgi:hypothetical protein
VELISSHCPILVGKEVRLCFMGVGVTDTLFWRRHHVPRKRRRTIAVFFLGII